MALKLIIGLGNPGAKYADTRHNAGAWFVESLAIHYQQTLTPHTKHQGRIATIDDAGHICRLFIPNSYMNVCGLPIKSFIRFYKIPIESILVAHDELDFPPGTTRLKQGGGHGGHNGLRDIIKHLHSNNFCRLRLGIGHPGNRDAVANYVLQKPSRADKIRIDQAIDTVIYGAASLLSGDTEKVMRDLHTDKDT